MSVRSPLAALVLMTALASPAMANMLPPASPQERPDAAIQGVYDDKLAAERVSDDFGRAETDALILRRFTPELLALYKSTFHVDEPVIDGDVFMMAQEWESDAVVTTRLVRETGEGRARSATVEARFAIAGEPRVVIYTLKLSPVGAWEIDDIAAQGQGSLRGWIEEAMRGAAP